MKRVPAQVLIGRDAKVIHLAQKLLPNTVVDKLLLTIYKKR